MHPVINPPDSAAYTHMHRVCPHTDALHVRLRSHFSVFEMKVDSRSLSPGWNPKLLRHWNITIHVNFPCNKSLIMPSIRVYCEIQLLTVWQFHRWTTNVWNTCELHALWRRRCEPNACLTVFKPNEKIQQIAKKSFKFKVRAESHPFAAGLLKTFLLISPFG